MELQDLTFKKEGSLYVCEFEATGPFNIKISRTSVNGTFDKLSLYQSLTGKDWVSVSIPGKWALMGEVDFEIPNVPEGMHLRIESRTEVTIAKIAYQS